MLFSKNLIIPALFILCDLLSMFNLPFRIKYPGYANTTFVGKVLFSYRFDVRLDALNLLKENKIII